MNKVRSESTTVKLCSGALALLSQNWITGYLEGRKKKKSGSSGECGMSLTEQATTHIWITGPSSQTFMLVESHLSLKFTLQFILSHTIYLEELSMGDNNI